MVVDTMPAPTPGEDGMKQALSYFLAGTTDWHKLLRVDLALPDKI